MHFYVNFEEVFRQCSRSLKCHFGALHLVKIALLSHKSYIRGRDLVRVGRRSGAGVGLSWSKDPPLLCQCWVSEGSEIWDFCEMIVIVFSPTITVATSVILFSNVRDTFCIDVQLLR